MQTWLLAGRGSQTRQALQRHPRSLFQIARKLILCPITSQTNHSRLARALSAIAVRNPRRLVANARDRMRTRSQNQEMDYGNW